MPKWNLWTVSWLQEIYKIRYPLSRNWCL
jgi:hypothetical protein